MFHYAEISKLVSIHDYAQLNVIIHICAYEFCGASLSLLIAAYHFLIIENSSINVGFNSDCVDTHIINMKYEQRT